MKTITLNHGHITTVDDDDYLRLSNFKWFAKNSRGIFYAARTDRSNGSARTVFMHHEIVGRESGLVVDHINCNSMDNRKSNLRLVTQLVNARNRRSNRNTSSKYKGVHKHKDGGWVAQIGCPRMYLGIFRNAEEAAIAYNSKAREIFGSHAKLNEVLS